MKTAYTGISRVVVGMVLGTMLYAGIALAEQNWKYCNDAAPVYGLFWIHYEGEGQGRVEHRLTFDDPEINTNYFDPNKPSIIYIHGFQPSRPFLPNERWDIEPTPVEDQLDGPYSTDSFGLGWVKNKGLKGYNVAVFDWKAFTAGFQAVEVEDRVWKYGIAQPFRKCFYQSAESGINNIAELFAIAYTQLVYHYALFNVQVEVVAHSMGTHVALRGLKIVDYGNNIPNSSLPNAITLIDPGMLNGEECDVKYNCTPRALEFNAAVNGLWRQAFVIGVGVVWWWDPGLIEYVDTFGFGAKKFFMVKAMIPSTTWWNDTMRNVVSGIYGTDWINQMVGGSATIGHLQSVDWYFRHYEGRGYSCSGYLYLPWKGIVYDNLGTWQSYCYNVCSTPVAGDIYPLNCP